MPVTAAPLSLILEREDDPAALAAQLPAHRWLSLLTSRIEDESEREQFVRQCTYCHQQGNHATRVPREDWQWDKVLNLMARMGGVLSPELRARVPELFRVAYDPATGFSEPIQGRGFINGRTYFGNPPVLERWVSRSGQNTVVANGITRSGVAVNPDPGLGFPGTDDPANNVFDGYH